LPVWRLLQFHAILGVALNALSLLMLASRVWCIITRSSRPGGETVTDIGAARAGYTELFNSLFFIGAGAGLTLLLLAPWPKRMVHEVH